MSEILIGVLRMPPELFWSDHEMTRLQHDSIRREAADEIERLQAECEELREDAERYRCIRKGNQWIVAATQTGFHVDGEELDGLIDRQMEK